MDFLRFKLVFPLVSITGVNVSSSCLEKLDAFSFSIGVTTVSFCLSVSSSEKVQRDLLSRNSLFH